MMKKIILLFLLINVNLVAYNQIIKGTILDNETIKIAAILNQIEKNIPSDHLYMHLDRNLYHPGDTIRFQAYIRDRKSGIMGSESISLHSLLLNQAHRTIDSARFRIANCTASGWLKIPETITPGNFSVTAFTSMMMNYDPEFVFSVPIRIDEQKNARLEMAQIADKSSSLSYQTTTIHPVIDLRFLPEGGTLIYAIPQRMAFHAVTSSGRTLKVNGEIRNQRGEKVADFSSGEFGPGLVEFTPLQGDTYFASLKGEELSGLKWPLPIPDSSGIAMRVNNNEWIINILLEGRGVEAKAYILAITMNNSLVFSRDVRLDSLFRLSVKTEELPAGTAYITLYDNELNPVAERLIFVNYHKKMNIEISSSSSAVNSGDETELILNTTDYKGENISSIISIAVIDSTSGYSSTLPFPDIGSTFLFDRNFYNNLPMSIKVHGLNNIDKKSIDLLLMTFGWRKFNLKDNSGITPDKILLDYDHLKISNLEPGKKGKLEIHVLTLEDANILTLPVDKDKQAFIKFNLLNDSVRRVRILADNRSTKNLISAKIEFPENRSFTDRAKQAHNEASYNINTPILAFNDHSGISIPIPNMKKFYSLSDSVINIEEVIIRPKRGPAPPPVYINKYEKLYKSGSIRTMTTKDFAVWPSFEYILQLFNPYNLDVENKVVYFRPSRTFDTTAALFVLDDIPIGNRYEAIDVLPTSEIASVTVLKGTQGFTFYGGAAIGGVVFVTTKTSLEDDQHKKNDDLMRSIRLFRTEIEYYIPTKEETDSIPGLQYRPTVLWMNEVFIDGKEPVKIRYPNNMAKGAAMVFVNGVSFTNRVGSNSYKYKIK